MKNLLTRKLELFGTLDDDDKRVLDMIIGAPRKVAAHQDIISEGEAPADVHLVLEGLCCRYKLLANGDRQIVAYLVPGDFCDLNVFILKEMDHSIATLTPSLVVDIPRAQILELLERPNIACALWWATLVDEATLREWLVNLGQRDAEQRIAHLFCELHLRLKSMGLVTHHQFELPLTQVELADTMGLSTVHANRSLQSLRARKLVEFRAKTVEIPDITKLRSFSGFNPNYLHLREHADKANRIAEKTYAA